MKTFMTTLTIGSVLVMYGCGKTEQISTEATTTQADQKVMDVSVEVEDGEIVLMINDEEQIFVLSEIMGNAGLGGIASGLGDDENVQIHVVVNGEKVDGMPEEMMQHVLEMIRGGNHGEMDVSFGWSSNEPEHGRMKMRHKGGGGSPQGNREMQEKMMHGWDQGTRGKMMEFLGGFSNPRNKMDGGRHERGDFHEDRDIPEEHQFIEEMETLREVGSRLANTETMAILGIHMIRDDLEGEERMDALEIIIEEAFPGSAVRNAALLVAIETLQELDEAAGATELMVELVLSNTRTDDN